MSNVPKRFMSLSKLNKRKKIRQMGFKNVGKTPYEKSTKKELTYVMIKPGFACCQDIVNDIINLFKQNELSVEFQSYEYLKLDKVAQHYKHLAEQPFFNDLNKYMTSDIVLKMVVSGENAVEKVRNLCGPTNPANAPQGTIRKKYGKNIQENCIHASATKGEGESEIRLHCTSETIDFLRRKGFEL